MSLYEIDIRVSDASLSYDITFDEDSVKTKEEQLVEQLKALFNDVKDLSYYQRYSFDGNNNLDDPEIKAMLLNAIQTGLKDARAEHSNQTDYDKYKDGYVAGALEQAFEEKDYYTEQAWECSYSMVSIERLNDFVEQLEEIAEAEDIDLDDDIFENDIDSYLRSNIVYAMEEADTSKIQDLYGQIGDLRMVYVPRDKNESIEDCLVECDAHSGSAVDVIPDENFARFLKMLNTPVKAYIDGVKEQFDVDLKNEDECDHAGDWNLLELEETSIPTRPQALTTENIIEVIENMNGYATPTLVFTVDPQVLINSKEGQSLIVTGGQIGLHDFLNGSGHIIEPDSPVVIPLDLDALRPEDGPDKIGSYSVDDVYGMVSSAYESTVKVVEPKKDHSVDNDAVASL